MQATLDSAPDPRRWAIPLTRILEQDNGTDPYGFGFWFQSGTWDIGFGVGKSGVIQDSWYKVLATGIYTSVFHDYRLDAQPDRSYKFYIDGVYKASGFGQAYSAPALIQLGDGTPTGSNAKAEIASFKFTQPDNVSGNIKGLQSKQFSILCENLTTGQSVTFVTATFDCQKSGLVVTPNDEINITTHGFAKPGRVRCAYLLMEVGRRDWPLLC